MKSIIDEGVGLSAIRFDDEKMSIHKLNALKSQGLSIESIHAIVRQSTSSSLLHRCFPKAQTVHLDFREESDQTPDDLRSWLIASIEPLLSVNVSCFDTTPILEALQSRGGSLTSLCLVDLNFVDRSQMTALVGLLSNEPSLHTLALHSVYCTLDDLCALWMQCTSLLSFACGVSLSAGIECQSILQWMCSRPARLVAIDISLESVDSLVSDRFDDSAWAQVSRTNAPLTTFCLRVHDLMDDNEDVGVDFSRTSIEKLLTDNRSTLVTLQIPVTDNVKGSLGALADRTKFSKLKTWSL